MGPYYNEEVKQGAKCCGCCCDMRRAVRIVNIINIIFAAITVVVFLVSNDPYPFFKQDNENYNMQSLEDSYKISVIISGIGIVFYILAIGGANVYNVWLVSLGIFWLIVSYVAGIILTVKGLSDFADDNPEADDWNSYAIPSFVISGIITALFIYPHVGFIMEVKQGIMSEETYNLREDYSCCCV